MKGKYMLSIYDSKVRFGLELERNITIIKGRSGTGKSTFYNMVVTLLSTNGKSSVHCNCKDKLRILDWHSNWDDEINNSHNKIFIADEHTHYIFTNEFARVVRNSDNYFIFITRSGKLTNLGYSIDSIFELVTEKNNDMYITKLCKRYVYEEENIKPDLVITEDSNSGFEMIKSVMNCTVISSNGNSNVYKTLMENRSRYNRIYIIVDGAAFGAFFERVMVLVDNTNVYLFAPESFEFMLLCEKTFRSKLTDELTKTYNYCDTTEFAHWEQYYTYLLGELCKKYFGVAYKKKTLDNFFKTDNFKEHIKNMLKDLVIDD